MLSRLGAAFRPFFVAVVVIQGIHVIEHIVQLVQVYVLGMPEDDALGLLGYVFQFQGTEEWLHLVFNVSYLLAIVLILLLLRPHVGRVAPAWAFWLFAVGGVGLESWHVVEHGVIIGHVIARNGCPCPGIGDVALGLSDTFLHFWYNTIAYLATLVPFFYFIRDRSSLAGSSWKGSPSCTSPVTPVS